MIRQVAPFILKTWMLLADENNRPLIRWHDSGQTFIVIDPDRFASDLLPTVFKHSNFASFVRQLNIYGFKKLPTCQQEYRHPNFQRDASHLLPKLTRQGTTASIESDIAALEDKVHKLSQALHTALAVINQSGRRVVFDWNNLQFVMANTPCTLERSSTAPGDCQQQLFSSKVSAAKCQQDTVQATIDYWQQVAGTSGRRFRSSQDGQPESKRHCPAPPSAPSLSLHRLPHPLPPAAARSDPIAIRTSSPECTQSLRASSSSLDSAGILYPTMQTEPYSEQRAAAGVTQQQCDANDTAARIVAALFGSCGNSERAPAPPRSSTALQGGSPAATRPAAPLTGNGKSDDAGSGNAVKKDQPVHVACGEDRPVSAPIRSFANACSSSAAGTTFGTYTPVLPACSGGVESKPTEAMPSVGTARVERPRVLPLLQAGTSAAADHEALSCTKLEMQEGTVSESGVTTHMRASAARARPSVKSIADALFAVAQSRLLQHST